MRVIKIHLLVWFLYFLIAYVSDLILEPSTRLPVELIIFLTHNIFLFYSIYYALRTFSSLNHVALAISIVRCLAIVAIFFAFKSIIIYKIYPLVYGTFADPPKIKWITAGVLWIINYTIFASAYLFYNRSIQKQRDIARMLREKMQQEKEKLELESTVYKAQINPHFLYNALSFLYSKSLPLSRELSTGIMRLSEIMRYSFRPDEENGLVKLEDEVAHIQNVIEMAQQRFNNAVFVQFTVVGETGHYYLIPFVLITLVENILKHGIINDESCPARIRLELKDQNELFFETWNGKRIGPKESSTSIGIQNTRKRLEYAYGTGCSFHITDTKDEFSIRLELPLKTRPTVQP